MKARHKKAFPYKLPIQEVIPGGCGWSRLSDCSYITNWINKGAPHISQFNAKFLDVDYQSYICFRSQQDLTMFLLKYA